MACDPNLHRPVFRPPHLHTHTLTHYTLHSCTHAHAYTIREEKTYIISTKTGSMRGAGTDANVFITLFGNEGTSGERRLDNDVANFERGRQDIRNVCHVHQCAMQSCNSSLLSSIPLFIDPPSSPSLCLFFSPSPPSLPSPPLFPFPPSLPSPPPALIFLQTRSLPNKVCGCGSCRKGQSSS